MENKIQKESRLSRYLLGRLSEDERALLEEEYFVDDDAFEQTLIAEEELIDAYAGGELSEEQRERFEEIFMRSRRGRDRVNFARDLPGVLSNASLSKGARDAGRAFRLPFPTKGAASVFALTAAMLAIIIGFSWLLMDRARILGALRQSRDERAELLKRTQELNQRSDSEQARIKELLAQLESERARSSPDHSSKRALPSSVITFILSPSLLRGSSAKTLNLPRGATSIALRLNIAVVDYAGYRAVIETPDRREVWRADSVEPRRAAGEVGIIILPPMPAETLPSGAYVLLLSGKRPDGGFESAGEYFFSIAKK